MATQRNASASKSRTVQRNAERAYKRAAREAFARLEAREAFEEREEREAIEAIAVLEQLRAEGGAF